MSGVLNLAEFIIRVESFNANINIPLVRKAYEFCDAAHAGQIRESGEPRLCSRSRVEGGHGCWCSVSTAVGADCGPEDGSGRHTHRRSRNHRDNWQSRKWRHDGRRYG